MWGGNPLPSLPSPPRSGPPSLPPAGWLTGRPGGRAPFRPAGRPTGGGYLGGRSGAGAGAGARRRPGARQQAAARSTTATPDAQAEAELRHAPRLPNARKVTRLAPPTHLPLPRRASRPLPAHTTAGHVTTPPALPAAAALSRGPFPPTASRAPSGGWGADRIWRAAAARRGSGVPTGTGGFSPRPRSPGLPPRGGSTRRRSFRRTPKGVFSGAEGDL